MVSINFDTSYCVGCKTDFDSNTQKTKHHIFPKFLNPAVNATIPLCKSCHEKLNNSYMHVINKGKKIHPEELEGDFSIFIDAYHKLRGQFKNGKIDRGKFGEGLWDNLVRYLGTVEERIK